MIAISRTVSANYTPPTDTDIILKSDNTNKYEGYIPGIEEDVQVKLTRELAPPSSNNSRLVQGKNGNDSIQLLQNRHAIPDEQYRAIHHLIDSLENARRVDRAKRLQASIVEGYLPLGYVNLGLNRLLDYNYFEGLQPGMGLQTSNLFSKRFKFDVFYSHSLKSGDNNFGASVTMLTSPGGQHSITLVAEKDLIETGGFSFLNGFHPLSDERFRRFSIQSLDRVVNYGASATSRLSPSFKTSVAISNRNVNPFMVYPFQTATNQTTVKPFEINEGKVQIKWQPLRNTMKQLPDKTENRVQFPVLWINFRAGQGLYANEINYLAGEFQLEQALRLSPAVTATIRTSSGHLSGNHLATQLYSGFGANRPGLSLESRNSFATMRSNEFAASTFSNIFFRTSLQTGLRSQSRFKPVITISSSAGWGSLSKQFKGSIKTFDKGFFESGIYLQRLVQKGLLSYGIALHYRYGPYRLDKSLDNLFLKIGLEVDMKALSELNLKEK